MPRPKIADARRSCYNANGRPKKVFASMLEAKNFMRENLSERDRSKKHAYVCPYGCGVHIGSQKRRMIFPDAVHPCGTRGCTRTEPHMPSECGSC